MIDEIDDSAGLGPAAYAAQLEELNDGRRELIVAPVRPGRAVRAILEHLRNGDLATPIVIVTTSDTLSWDRYAGWEEQP